MQTKIDTQVIFIAGSLEAGYFVEVKVLLGSPIFILKKSGRLHSARSLRHRTQSPEVIYSK
jgi:hypothetical protein